MKESSAALIVALHEHLSARDVDPPDALYVDTSLLEVQRTVRALGSMVGFPFDILLAPSAVMVAGRFLCAPRWVHEAADDLRARAERSDISELSFAGEPSREDLVDLARACSHAGSALRDTGMLRWRSVRALALVRGIDLEPLDPAEHFETAYGWAVASVRRVTAEVAREGASAELRARQIARTLLELPSSHLAALVYSDRVRARMTDPAERAIGSAILTIAMLRRLTSEPMELVESAVAAMMLEAIAQAAAEVARPNPLHPAIAARALQAISRTDEGSVLRAVVTYEALWLEHQERLGPLYGGTRAPSLHASIVRAAHLCFERPDAPLRDAIEQLHRQAANDRDRAVLRLLCAATGQGIPSSDKARAVTARGQRREAGRVSGPSSGERPSQTQVSRDTFSAEDMQDILADLGGDVQPPDSGRSSRPSRRVPSGPPSDGRSSHAPVARSSDAPKRISAPPAIVPGNLVDESERVAQAEAAFDAAEAAYAVDELEDALTEADTAVMFMPQRPSFVALQAYLEALTSDRDSSVIESLMERIDRAFIGAEPDARAHYYRGMLLRYAGKPFAAKQAFRKGLDLAPADPDLLNALAGG